MSLELVTAILIVFVLMTVWNIIYTIYFLSKYYTSFKVHLQTLVYILSCVAIYITLSNNQINYERKLAVLCFLFLFIIISILRQLYLFSKHRNAAITEKIIMNFASKYNIGFDGNFQIKDLISKANTIFADENASNADRIEAFKVLKRVAKMSELMTKYKNQQN